MSLEWKDIAASASAFEKERELAQRTARSDAALRDARSRKEKADALLAKRMGIKTSLARLRVPEVLEAIRVDRWEEGEVQFIEQTERHGKETDAVGYRLISEPYPRVTSMISGDGLVLSRTDTRSAISIYSHLDEEGVVRIRRSGMVMPHQGVLWETVQGSGLRGLQRFIQEHQGLESLVKDFSSDVSEGKFYHYIWETLGKDWVEGRFPSTIRDREALLIERLPEPLKVKGDMVDPDVTREWVMDMRGRSRFYKGTDRILQKVGLRLPV